MLSFCYFCYFCYFWLWLWSERQRKKSNLNSSENVYYLPVNNSNSIIMPFSLLKINSVTNECEWETVKIWFGLLWINNLIIYFTENRVSLRTLLMDASEIIEQTCLAHSYFPSYCVPSEQNTPTLCGFQSCSCLEIFAVCLLWVFSGLPHPPITQASTGQELKTNL